MRLHEPAFPFLGRACHWRLVDGVRGLLGRASVSCEASIHGTLHSVSADEENVGKVEGLMIESYSNVERETFQSFRRKVALEQEAVAPYTVSDVPGLSLAP